MRRLFYLVLGLSTTLDGILAIAYDDHEVSTSDPVFALIILSAGLSIIFGTIILGLVFSGTVK